MPSQITSSVENNFTKGLITEATGLNFPENAATDCSNCTFTLVGDVIRREGINNEISGTSYNIDRTNSALSDYVWNNPGGDGNSKLWVQQVGNTLYFYNIATATASAPISTKKLSSTVLISNAVAAGGAFNQTLECTYADGNGYLFVYHPTCDPFYVTYNASTLVVTPNIIQLQVRDFQGVNDNLPVNTRPSDLTNEHFYNLLNQGWVQGGGNWSATSVSPYTFETAGLVSWIVQVGLPIDVGTSVAVIYTGAAQWGFPDPGQVVASGPVQSYSAGTGLLTLEVTGTLTTTLPGPGTSFALVPTGPSGMTNTFRAAANVYPSNSDIWWTFKDVNDTFNPSVTLTSQTLTTGQAPQGHFILNAFNQNKGSISGVNGITSITTTARTTNGAWYAGRVWYTGVSGFQTALGDENFYTWTENIYFSQVVSSPSDFGLCYQTNDPTSDQLNSILPTDGGVITIVGSGTIHKLFPISNGVIVFANNGVWFITGSQGIGFAANDYTITKLSSIKMLSNKSFVDVTGLPFFWNEEGIYQVMPSQGGALTVNPITVGTIQTFYDSIPLASKKYARGDYDPINYVIQWGYRSTEETSVTDRYQFDTIMNFNTYNKAFFPYTISQGLLTNYIHSVRYINYPYIATSTPEPGFKYVCSFFNTVYQIGVADENDGGYVDWGASDYDTYFIVGFKVHGGAWRKFQLPYIYVYSRTDGIYAAYYIQGLWDYASNSDSNRWSTLQFVEIFESNKQMVPRRHKIRGQGLVLQLKITAVSRQPFDIMGWAMVETINQGA